jgi:hypothetical protein
MQLSYVASKGAPGEWTFDRFSRQCLEQGINANPSGNGSVQMGRQYIQGFENHLLEMLTSSLHGGIVESRTANELLLLGTGTYRGTFDYAAGDLFPDLEPDEDDKNTANIVRLSNSHAGQAVLSKTAGEMSTAAIGPFEDKLSTNNWTFAQAQALAGRRLAEGTWPGPRFPEVSFSARARPALYDTLRAIDVGDFFGLQNMSAAGYYDLMVFRVLCIEEKLNQVDHLFTFTVKPGEIDYRLWTVGTNRVDIADSTVAVDNGATVDVNVPSAKWSTTAAPLRRHDLGDAVDGHGGVEPDLDHAAAHGYPSSERRHQDPACRQ